MSIFSACFRAGVKNTQTKFASSSHNARPKASEGKQTDSQSRQRAPLPPGFDATKARTFMSQEQLKQSSQPSQLNAFAEDLPVLQPPARHASLDDVTLSAPGKASGGSKDTLSLSASPARKTGKTVSFAEQAEAFNPGQPRKYPTLTNLTDDSRNTAKTLLQEANERAEIRAMIRQKQRQQEFQKSLENSAKSARRPRS